MTTLPFLSTRLLRHGLLLAALAAIALATVACAATPSPAAGTTPAATKAPPPATVTIRTFQYGAPLTIAPGTTVTWTNEDDIGHSVTSGMAGAPDGRFDSGLFRKGGTWSHTFTEPREYPYFCTAHPSMVGRVIVTGAGAGAGAGAQGPGQDDAAAVSSHSGGRHAGHSR